MRRKRRKQRKIIILTSIALLFVLTTGYATFQTNLNITAKGNIKTKGIKVSDLKQNTVSTEDGLYKDSIDEERYIYRGSNPDNYIMFNDELWRIIAIESDNSLKIMNNKDLGIAIAWDNDANPKWETASLNKYLNETYYNTLTEEAKKFIFTHTFNTGKFYLNWDEDVSLTSLEKDVSNEKREKWQGNVGLLNPTDFIKSTIDPKCVSGRASWLSADDMPCKNQNWLYKEGENFWTINANDPTNTKYEHNGWLIHNYLGGYELNGKYSTQGVDLKAYPVVFLKPDITLKGEGTKNNPYTVN